MVSSLRSYSLFIALFGDDIRQLAFSKEADDVFYILTIISMVLFLFEVVLASLVKEDYFLSFYFWLDFISTVSLIFDIGWFWDAILGTGSSVNSAKNA